MFFPIFQFKIVLSTTTFTEKLNTAATNYKKKQKKTRIRKRVLLYAYSQSMYTYSQSTFSQSLGTCAPIHKHATGIVLTIICLWCFCQFSEYVRVQSSSQTLDSQFNL